LFIHGGAWRAEEAKDYGFAAELFVNAGVNFIALDFTTVPRPAVPPPLCMRDIQKYADPGAAYPL